MNKILALPLAVLAVSPALVACSTTTTGDVAAPSVEAREKIPDPEPVPPPPTEKKSFEIVLDGGFAFGRTPIAGVRRRFDFSGSYTVEYVHTPYGMPADDTLDYSVQMNGDNTYTMTVVSDGVKSEHFGHWYGRGGSITFYFDEPVDPPAHNEYVSDCIFAEVLPQSKLMIYDGGRTVVLSKSDAENA